jgi:hypothetical protein
MYKRYRISGILPSLRGCACNEQKECENEFGSSRRRPNGISPTLQFGSSAVLNGFYREGSAKIVWELLRQL